MDFEFAVPLTHSPAAVQDALLDPEFRARTGSLPKVGGADVLECTHNDTTAHLRVRYKFTAPLSRAVTAVVDPAKLTWVDDGHFDLVQMRSDHVMLPDYYADRLTSSYATTLTADGTGSTWTVVGSLDVRAPLVGGKVAAVIVEGLGEYAHALGVALDAWLAGDD